MAQGRASVARRRTEESRERLLLRRELVGSHQLDRRARQQPRSAVQGVDRSIEPQLAFFDQDQRRRSDDRLRHRRDAEDGVALHACAADRSVPDHLDMRFTAPADKAYQTGNATLHVKSRIRLDGHANEQVTHSRP
jgi:hypothetical protein